MPAVKVNRNHPLHLILVLDNSGSMEGAPAKAVNDGIRDLIGVLEDNSGGGKELYFKLSIIRFGTSADLVAEGVWLKDIQPGQMIPIGGDGGSTNAAAGIETAIAVLQRHAGSPADFNPYVLLFSDGEFDDGPAAQAAATRLKALGIPAGTPRLMTLGFGSANEVAMKSLATNSENYFRIRTLAEIRALLPAIGSSLTQGGSASQVARQVGQIVDV